MLYEEEKLRLIYLARETEDYSLESHEFGSCSVLVPTKNHILITPGKTKRFTLRTSDIIVLDRKGDVVENTNDNIIPNDVDFHIIAYEERDHDIDVIMHINPQNASVRADEGNRIIFLSDCIDPDQYEPEKLLEVFRNSVKHRDYLLIKHSGILIVGNGVFDTLDKARYIEEIAKIKMPKEENTILKKEN